MENELIMDPREFSLSTIDIVMNDSNARGFNIPIYQRLYSWGKKEVDKLLSDVLKAAEYPEHDYYLGNVTLNFNVGSSYYNVIDGQQRLTTLWLAGLVLKLKGYLYWEDVLVTSDQNVLLNFTARTKDMAYLFELISSASLEAVYTINSNDVNPMMIDAIKNIDRFLSIDKKIAVDRFSEFMFNHTKMVAIYLPNTINLNKYFEDMNNRGLQLEPQHILKAILLKGISEKRVKCFANIWDAVSQMNRYIEYNLDGTLRANRENLIDGPSAIGKYINEFHGSDVGITLSELIRLGIQEGAKEAKPRYSDNPPDKIGTIIKFEEFLLHCLRLFTGDYSIPIDDKRLLKEFQKPGRSIEPEAFIRVMFKYRLLYDQYIIKSMDTGDGYIWDIRRIEKDEDEYTRGSFIEEKAIIQLQSLLNVSTASSRWLTKTLKYLEETDFKEHNFFEFLEKLDTDIAFENLSGDEVKNLLNRGTGTNRYWFFKLDYLLWRSWTSKTLEFPRLNGINGLFQCIKNFQFRDNRSVEHIEPRNPDREKWEADQDIEIGSEELIKLKDRFGNLALISVSANSSYNNQPTKNKKQDFISRSNKWGIESLKLLHAYHYEDWTIEQMKDHDKKMADILINTIN